MNKSRVLTIALIAAVAIWVLSLGLYVHLTQYDLYGWAVPGQESVQSRNLWLARRDLYMWAGVIAFLAACVLGVLKILGSRRRRDTLASS
jgi:hypothetical protein